MESFVRISFMPDNLKLVINTKIFWFCILSIICIFAGLVYFWATSPFGIGIHADSINYIWSARNFADGIGLGRTTGDGSLKPLTQWPPLYPLILSLFEWIEIGALQGARLIGVICSVLILFLGCMIIWRLTQSPLFGLITIILLFFSPGLTQIQLDAMTEAPFIVFALLTFITTDKYIQTHQRKWIVITAIWIMLGTQTRYAGISLAIVTLCFLYFSHLPIREKIFSIFIISMISGIPLILWFVRNFQLTGNAGNRLVRWIPLSRSDINWAIRTITAWIDPWIRIIPLTKTKILFSISILSLFGITTYWKQKISRPHQPDSINVFYLLFGFIFSYVGSILVARLAFDPYVAIGEERILSPLYTAIILLGVFGFHQFIQFSNKYIFVKYFLPIIGCLIFATFLSNNYLLVIDQYKQIHKNGKGYGRQELKNSQILEDLNTFPQKGIIYSDNIEQLYFLTGLSSFALPDPLTEAWSTPINLAASQGQELIIAVIQPTTEKELTIQKYFNNFTLFSSKDGLLYTANIYPK